MTDFDTKYADIVSKANTIFLDGILDKEELKIIFYRSFYRFSESSITFGYPIQNLTNSECFRITGFNIFMRMQEKIWDEIDNLCDISIITALSDKVKANKCLTIDETKMFNKYLLLQTSIEMTSNELLNKIYPGDVIPTQRQKLLNERFKLLSVETDKKFYANPINYDHDPVSFNKLTYLINFCNKFNNYLNIHDFEENKFKLSFSEFLEELNFINSNFEEKSIKTVVEGKYSELVKKINDELIDGLNRIKTIEKSLDDLNAKIVSKPDKTTHDASIENQISELNRLFKEIRELKQKDKEQIPKEKGLGIEFPKKGSKLRQIDKRDIEELIKNRDKYQESSVDFNLEKFTLLVNSIKILESIESKISEYKALSNDSFYDMESVHNNNIILLNENKYDKLLDRRIKITEFIEFIKEFLTKPIDTIENQFETFTDENCEFTKIRSIYENILQEILATTYVKGNISSKFLIYFSKYAFNNSFLQQIIPEDSTDVSLNKLKGIYDISTTSCKNDYLILNLGGFQNLYPPKSIFNDIKIITAKHSDGILKTYKLVGVAYNCNSKHSVSSICYGDRCLSDPVNHEQINENNTYEFKLEDPLKETNLCTSANYKIEMLLYEPIETVSKLKAKVDLFKVSYSNIKDIVISGGGVNYYLKYLKYKQKYLALKKIDK